MQGYLVADQSSRTKCQIDVSDIQKHNVQIVSSLRQILTTNSEYNGSEPIIILSPLLDNAQNVVELKLFHKLAKYKYILVTSDVESISTEIRSMVEMVYELPLLSLTWAECLAMLNDDTDTLVRMNNKSTMVDTVLEQIENRVDVPNYLLMDALKQLKAENTRLEERLSFEISAAFNAKQNTATQALRLQELDGYVETLFRQAVEVNNVSSKYELLCRPYVLDRLSLGDYPNHPNVLYFKQYGDFLWLNSFLAALIYIFKVQLHRSVKVLIVGDSYDLIRKYWLPKACVKFESSFSPVEIFTKDYLYCSDGYMSLLDYICINKVGLEYLIIIDSKPVESLIVNQSDIVRFDLVRNLTKSKTLGIPELRAIVNADENRVLSWNYYPEYNNLVGVNQMAFLAARPVMLEIIKACEWFGDKLV